MPALVCGDRRGPSCSSLNLTLLSTSQVPICLALSGEDRSHWALGCKTNYVQRTCKRAKQANREFYPSPVRNGFFDCIFAYMQHSKGFSILYGRG